MLNNFIGGGQIFLHKIRMCMQVLHRSSFVAFLIACIVVFVISYQSIKQIDHYTVITYQKAYFSEVISNITKPIRGFVNPKGKYKQSKIDAYTKDGIYAKNIAVQKIVNYPTAKDR